MTDQKKTVRQPDTIPAPQPDSGPEPDERPPAPSVSVPPTGRTIANVRRERRTIT